jgi:hypothetical protein
MFPVNQELWVEGVRDGGIAFNLSYTGTCLNADASLTATITTASLVPDCNHDRQIDSHDVLAIATNDFRIWINDDADNGDVADSDSDVPWQTSKANYHAKHVSGCSRFPNAANSAIVTSVMNRCAKHTRALVADANRAGRAGVCFARDGRITPFELALRLLITGRGSFSWA